MRKHYFLGQAAAFGVKKTFRFLFSFGTKKDFEELKQILADRYSVEKKQVYLFHSGRTALALALLSRIPSAKSQKQIKTNNKMQSKQIYGAGFARSCNYSANLLCGCSGCKNCGLSASLS